MKKTYETPVAEKIEFCYEEQIVASAINPDCVFTSVRGYIGCAEDFTSTK